MGFVGHHERRNRSSAVHAIADPKPSRLSVERLARAYCQPDARLSSRTHARRLWQLAENLHAREPLGDDDDSRSLYCGLLYPFPIRGEGWGSDHVRQRCATASRSVKQVWLM